jgi:hypothetical protein
VVLNTLQGEYFVQEVDISISVSRVAGIIENYSACPNARELIDDEKDYIDGSSSHVTYSHLTWQV